MSFTVSGHRIFGALHLCAILFFVKSAQADSYIPEVTITPSYLDERIGFGKQQTQENNKKQQKETLIESLRQVPGLKISSFGDTSIQNYIKLRGTNTEHTAVRIFGLKINDVANGGRFDFSNVASSDIKLTDVHNFSSESTIGGTIDLIPEQGYGPFQTTLNFEGGSYNTVRTRGSISGSTQKSDYHVTGHALKSGAGSFKNKRLGNTLSDHGFDTSLTTRLGHLMTPDWHVDLYASYNQIFTRDNAISNGLPVKSDNNGVYQRGFFLINNHFKTLNHFWEHDVAVGHIQSRYDQSFKSDYFDYLNKGQSLKGAYNTRLKFHPHQHLLTSIGTTQDITKQNDLNRHTLKSHYAQLTYVNDLIPKLVLETRGRLDNHTFSNVQGTYFGSAQYYFNLKFTIFARYGTGFEAPTTFDFYSSSPFSIDNLCLKPVTSQNFDAGFEAKPFRFLILSLSYFRINIHNLLTTTKNAQGQYQRINSDGRRTQGLESSAHVQLNQNTQFRAGYTLTYATDQPNNLLSIRLARHQFHTGVDFVYQEKTTLFTELSYESPIKDIDFYSMPTKRVTLPAIVNLRLGGAYKMSNHLEVTTHLENALNQQAEYIYGFASRSISAYIGIRIKG